jgi:hypothetical protein
MMGGIVDSIEEVRASLDRDVEELIHLLDRVDQWLEVDNDTADEQRELAYEKVWAIRGHLVEIIGSIKGAHSDSHLSSVGERIAVKCIENIYSAINFDDESALIFSAEMSTILFLIQPYLNEVTLRRYGGKLFTSAQMCNNKLQKAREGKIKAPLIPLFISMQGFYSLYARV